MRYILFINVLLLCSCVDLSDCDVKLVELGPVLQGEVVKELKKEGVGYSIIDGRICVEKTNAEKAASVLGRVVNENVPIEYSVSLDTEVHNLVINKLNNENVPFKVFVVGGERFIVWDKKDASVVTKLIDAVRSEYIHDLQTKKGDLGSKN